MRRGQRTREVSVSENSGAQRAPRAGGTGRRGRERAAQRTAPQRDAQCGHFAPVHAGWFKSLAHIIFCDAHEIGMRQKITYRIFRTFRFDGFF